jgi:regulator of PEP synthase PpsR (kinase-PPPase family)
VAGLREADALFSTSSRSSSNPRNELGQRSTHAAGRFHGIAESQDYKRRIEAINFTLAHDDGVSHADLAEPT